MSEETKQAPVATVTRIVRGPGRYLGRKKGERVEVPANWIGSDPTVEKCTMSLDEADRLEMAKVEAAAVKQQPGGLRDVVAKFYNAAAAQLDASEAAVKAKRGE